MNLFEVYSLFPLEPVRGQGSYVFTADGTRYLDFYGGHAVISIGHAHPHYVSKIQEQVARLGFYSNSVENSLQEELASKLGQLSGMDDYRLFLVSSGAEANENALKLASFHTGRRRIIAFTGAFHGRTSAAVNATDNDKIKAPINRGYPVTFLDFGDEEGIATELAKEDVAAVIIEGIQGVGGIHAPDTDFLRALQRYCHAHGSLLILDEVQSGYGRTGAFFAFQHAEGLRPDIVSMAKGMGNGFPIGGVLIAPHIKAKPGMLGTTFGGSHLACAAGIAVLDVLEREDLIARARVQGESLMQRLRAKKTFTEVRGRGLMIGLQHDGPIAPLRERLLFEEHIFTGSSKGPNTIRLLPPLNVGEEECNRVVAALSQESERVPRVHT